MLPGFVFCVICRDKWTMEHFLFWLVRNVLPQWLFVTPETNELTVKCMNVINFAKY